jgi:hypothetical protein
MIAKPFLSRILEDEALTRGLGDPEARILIEWLVERAEQVGRADPSEGQLRHEISRLCLRGRSISRFVALWCHAGAPGAALQLASTERFSWPLPTALPDPCELMQEILEWESDHPKG